MEQFKLGRVDRPEDVDQLDSGNVSLCKGVYTRSNLEPWPVISSKLSSSYSYLYHTRLPGPGPGRTGTMSPAQMNYKLLRFED